MSAGPRYLVSALCTVHGSGRFMRGLLEDLEAQTIADRMEIVVVDSASPENERAIVEEFQQRYDNIRYVRTAERECVAAGMNRTIQLAQGRYVTPAAADDRHRPDMFERMVAVLEANPDVGLAYADCAVTLTENETFATATPVAHFRWPDFDLRHMFQICYIGPQPVWRRELNDRFGGFDTTYVTAGDYELWLRFAAGGVRFLHVPEVLGLYLKCPTSNEHANLDLSAVESEQARIRHWNPAWGPRPPLARRGYLVPVEAPPASSAPPPSVAPPSPRPPAAPPPPAAARRAFAPGAPLVSVIIPTYDRPDRLPRAVESVLRQTYPEVEVIVVNDGGVDVAPVLAPFDDGGRVTHVRLGRNRERSGARNAGLRLARGEWVAYLDDDDWFAPDHVAGLVAALEARGLDVAYSDAQRVLETRHGDRHFPVRVETLPSQEFNPDALLVGNYIQMPCLLHRRRLIDEVGGFDEELQTHEDWEFLIRLSRAHAFVHVPQATAIFTWRDDGTSTTSRRPADLVRTLARIHERYAAEVRDRPHLREMQVRFLETQRAKLSAPSLDCSIVLSPPGEVCRAALPAVTRGIDYEVLAADAPGPAGRERAARRAQAPVLVFVEGDVVPREGWLRALLRELAADPGVVATCAKRLDVDGTVGGVPPGAPETNRRGEVSALAAGAFAVRRAAFDAAGGFGEATDDDGALAALAAALVARGGRIVYAPRSEVQWMEADRPVESAPALLDAARAALAAGVLDGADERVERLLSRAPEHAEGWLLRGTIALERGRPAAAFDAYATALQHGADARTAGLGVVRALLAQGDADAAWTIVRDLVAEFPAEPEPMQWMLQAGTALRRWAALADALEGYVARNPDDAAMRFALARVLVRAERGPEARRHYEALRATNPSLVSLDELVPDRAD